MSESKNNHQDIFLFHRCCKSLEQVSIWNMNVVDSDSDFDAAADDIMNEDQQIWILTQNI